MEKEVKKEVTKKVTKKLSFSEYIRKARIMHLPYKEQKSRYLTYVR